MYNSYVHNTERATAPHESPHEKPISLKTHEHVTPWPLSAIFVVGR